MKVRVKVEGKVFEVEIELAAYTAGDRPCGWDAGRSVAGERIR